MEIDRKKCVQYEIEQKEFGQQVDQTKD